jgi:PKD repeat protein
MPAPVAAFSGTPLTGVVPVSVVFTDASTNVPTSWAWDFGDGVTDTAQSPTHKYVQAGSYTVTLTATNASGSDDETKIAYVVVTASQMSLVMDGLAALITAGAFVDNVYAFPSPTVSVPCAVVGYPSEIVFDSTFQGTLGYQPHNRYVNPVWFLVAQGDSLTARDALSNILTGTNSVKSVLDGLHAFGTTRCTDGFVGQVPIADVIYVGARFDTETET